MEQGITDLEAVEASEGPIKTYLLELLEEVRRVQGGDVATYIPELAKANPKWLGVCIATVDGHVYTAGDADVPFTIQSVSKPFLYGLALEQRGRDDVLRHVGVEPTGEAFNAIVLDEENNRPYNPMVNAGAIAVSALVKGATYAERRETMRALLERFAGHALAIDETVFQSERETGERNKAIAALMDRASMLEGDRDEILDLYFSQCSVLVTCRDLALMAATLANGGVQPVTQMRALSSDYIHDVLTVMNSCGMYNYAGQWSYEVGVPAKSGVSGSIMAAVPGQIGIAAFAPPLDRLGNSVRGIVACKRIAADFGLHVFRASPDAGAAIRSEATGAEMRSKRRRSASEREILDGCGERIGIIEAQGGLFFGSTEKLLRTVNRMRPDHDFLIIDFRRVYQADAAAVALILRLAREAGHATLLFAHISPAGFMRNLHSGLCETGHEPMLFPSRDLALEWCEDQLIAQHPAPRAEDQFALKYIDLFKDFSVEDLHVLEGIAQALVFEAGQQILREGDVGHSFLVIAQGSASVRLRLDGERAVRVATVGAGGAIGDLALLDGGRRSADVVADRRTLCYAFSIEALKAHATRNPELWTAILTNLAHDLSARLRSANSHIRSLER
ncbi:MAG: glutaminase A [Alphaproteobacteria bacterium]|nr:glutaminase A [Alphaproteobacteria bacterium]